MTRGPGLIGALLVGVASREGAGRRARAAARPPSTTCTATWWPARSARPDRGALPVPGGQRRPHLPRPRGRPGLLRRCSARRSTTPPARRSTRAPGCWAWATRAARSWTGWRARATRTRSTSRARRPGDGLDFSFSGLKTALLYAVRDLGEEQAEARRADLAASYQRAIVAALVARHGPGGGARGRGPRWPSAAAWRPTASCAPRWPSARPSWACELWIPPRELCTDNAAMIAAAARFTEPLAYPGLPGPGRGRQAGGVKLTLYGKAGCHLCDEAYAEVADGPGRDVVRARGRRRLPRPAPAPRVRRADPGAGRRRRGGARAGLRRRLRAGRAR